ncbi:hypothetical protein [Marivivens aquimaris]|uniref:hypothetical protein n=1 Tax=Marivivens aquimaris TaxID=2774876 RepID=UPI0018807846|nr:hypothetical protein [Marivivens aquimaris]
MSAVGPILFLDLATTTGWCDGLPVKGEKPQSGSVRLAYQGATPGEKYDALVQFIGARFAVTRYQYLVWEAPLDPRSMGGKTNVNTARTLITLAGICDLLATSYGVRPYEVHVSTVKSFILNGRRVTGAQKKTAIIEAVTAAGYSPSDDNEADAIAGWLFAANKLAGRPVDELLPLLRK